jgi:hypothetical protein
MVLRRTVIRNPCVHKIGCVPTTGIPLVIALATRGVTLNIRPIGLTAYVRLYLSLKGAKIESSGSCGLFLRNSELAIRPEITLTANAPTIPMGTAFIN